ncbi:hypothetical protein [Aureimonas jatrophae]|uniref:Uncharacterized protein n=1 Tax=Aureimonas jatrophae TaxID=1166073 RepID=A0A1H0M3Z3_9HYPH|nr:hypothetical protein [Aureimonas jatrophae]MBB3952639.1 hypothetical protein [Aureimonas jatrophae]SDO74936.1 hypothetical protein SAMN05192530_11253 [Aureimonas jatrophae]
MGAGPGVVRLVGCDDRSPDLIEKSVEDSGVLASGAARLDPLAPDVLKEQIKSLFSDVRECLKQRRLPEGGAFQSRLGQADILLLDYGLTQFPDFGIRLTAEHLAGYVRAFTDTPYVVSLNKLKNVDFDLKYLLGDFDTRADLALKTEHLAVSGLWTGVVGEGVFCPWYWPKLLDAPARRRAQVQIVKERMNESILSTIGMPASCVSFLSRQAIAFLSPFGQEAPTGGTKDVREVTFWDHFLSSNRTLPDDDRREILASADVDVAATECPDDDALRTIVARVVAAELEFWFRRDVLGPQQLLIDPPHLQARLRVARGDGRDTAENWSDTARRREAPFGLDEQSYGTITEPGMHESPWVDGPSFWLPIIEETPEFLRISEEAIRFNELYFCEDTRRFRPRGETSRFVTDLTKGADIRFVERVDPYVYSPASLFAR